MSAIFAIAVAGDVGHHQGVIEGGVEHLFARFTLVVDNEARERFFPLSIGGFAHGVEVEVGACVVRQILASVLDADVREAHLHGHYIAIEAERSHNFGAMGFGALHAAAVAIGSEIANIARELCHEIDVLLVNKTQTVAHTGYFVVGGLLYCCFVDNLFAESPEHIHHHARRCLRRIGVAMHAGVGCGSEFGFDAVVEKHAIVARTRLFVGVAERSGLIEIARRTDSYIGVKEHIGKVGAARTA